MDKFLIYENKVEEVFCHCCSKDDINNEDKLWVIEFKLGIGGFSNEVRLCEVHLEELKEKLSFV